MIEWKKRIGNIFGFTGGNYAGNVYDQNYIAPTLNTMQGGYKQPMIIEANSVRFVRTEEGKRLRKMYESHEIHHGFNEHREMELRTDGVVNTLSTVQKDNYICEKSIVAMRGRNPDNPSDRTVGSPTEQRLEPNSQGICNTLTSVQKYNLVLEKECLGGINYKVSEDFQKGILKDCARSILSGNDGAACVERSKIKQATKDGYIECKVGGVADLSFPDSSTRRGRVQDMGDTCPTLMAGESDICRIESRYRIRKLTPQECWRLMDFTDEDFHKAEQVNSNTQLYKQAGNSIVKNVLVAIFGQMIPGKEKLYKEL